MHKHNAHRDNQTIADDLVDLERIYILSVVILGFVIIILNKSVDV